MCRFLDNMVIAEKTEQRDRISGAAFELFCQRGIKGVSMDDIAQHLAMSKKTIYKWFDNKNDMVNAAVSNYLSNMEHTACELSNAANAVEELFNLVQMSRQIFSQLNQSIFYELQKYHPEAWQLWIRHKNEFTLKKIRQNMLRGISEGLFRQDLDVEVMARLRLAQIEIPFNRDFFPPHEFDLTHVQMASLELYMLGIATLKGHKLINSLKHITEEE